MKKILLAFSVLLFFSSSSYGQAIRNFTSDPVKFIEEMNSFLTETNKKEGEALMEKFAEVWKQGKFSAAQQEAIYKTANGMLRKHMKAFPDFKNYLSTLISFINSSQSAESFNGWQQSLDKLILMPSKHFATYINVCNNLFSGNSLYLSASTRWYSDNNNYKFEFDSLPKIIFPQMNLTCVSKGDSAVIKNTHGFYYPTRSAFWGEGGNVNWERGGWDAKTVFAQFAHFVIDVTGSDYTADSVLYTNSAYFSQPLLGKYSDKILANASPENASYPRFVSYNTSFKIKNIVPDIDYDGGFSMEGNKMIGSGNKEADAHLTFYNGKKSFLIAASKNFVIRKDKITSGHASVIMLMDTDTVYHPGLTLKYIVQDRELALIRGEDGGSMSPYYDSYHDVDMYFDALYWKIDNPTMDLKMLSGAGENEALFQSSNYFRMNKFLQLQGINSVHPLFTLKQFVQKNNSKIIYTDELAKYMRIAPSEVRHLFIDLSNQGFVIYDGVDDKALLKDRLYYYLLASTGKTDYDVIQFESIIKNQPNASINLLNYEITLRGVKEIVLSDSQNVIIYPREQEVHLKKNRDFNFAGRVHAGRFDFYGKQFDFDYQNFKINLENVDSLRLKVESDSLTDSEGKKRLVYVKSVLQKINGDLLIDYLGNKSGLKEYSQYPIFNSKKDSYVYYSKPEIQEGVYTQDRFYFHLDPFTIDSLDNFTREGLRFDGELVSAGIFETFRDTLKLQPDISLGLVRETSAEGWPAYGGKGKVTSTLALSNNGLHGNGTLEYVSSTTHSDDYLFLPDSMNSFVTDFTSKKETLAGTEFPDVKANYVYEHWEPNKDVMHVNMRKDTMSMYEGQSLLAGNLQLRPTGLTGNGQMSFAKSLLESHLFRYKSDVFDADTSDFRLTAENTSAVAFSTNDVKAHIDFAKRFGDFKANSGGNYVKFDLNQYICFIDQFKWFMDQEELEMTSSGSDTTSSGLSLTGSEFISVEPTQDSLRFRAPFAKYSLRDYLIKAEKVALIQTADASIIPDSGKVVVERYAKMQTLTNSVIVANNITKYHSIYNANVDILGRKKYEGSGDYDYVDENKIKHHLHFDKVGVDTTFQTYADGDITDSSFALSPQFLFKGHMHLIASRQFLIYSGYVQPNFRCQNIDKSWIKFTSDIDPNKVMIPLDNFVTDDGRKLSAAVMQASEQKGIYPAFLMPKNKLSDTAVIESNGVLSYNKNAEEFVITTKEKLEKPNTQGNYLSLNDRKCIVTGEGKLSFGADFGQFKLTTAGNVNYNFNNDSTKFDLLLAMDFFFCDEAIKQMGDYFSQNGALAPTQDNGRVTYEKGLAQLLGKEKADKLITEINLYGAYKKMPDELRHTFFFSDVKMEWEKQSHSFRSVGPIGIGSIDKASVNKMVKGYIEIIHKRMGDVITFYLEPENGTWFYFSYSRGYLQALSSSSAFSEAVHKIKSDKRVNKEKNLPDFEYLLSTDRAVKNFLKKFQVVPVEQQEEKKDEEK